MDKTIHDFATGIRNGYQLSDEYEKYIDALLEAGFKITRPNSLMQFGPGAAQELRMRLLKYLESH